MTRRAVWSASCRAHSVYVECDLVSNAGFNRLVVSSALVVLVLDFGQIGALIHIERRQTCLIENDRVVDVKSAYFLDYRCHEDEAVHGSVCVCDMGKYELVVVDSSSGCRDQDQPEDSN